MLPCCILDFFLYYQPDEIIIQIYSVTKFYTFQAPSLPNHQEFSTVHLAVVSYMQVFDDRFQAESGWNS